MEKIDLAFFGYIGLATLCVGVSIALWVNRAAWLPIAGRIVSTLSGGWQSSVERARQQKAARDLLYGYGIEPDGIDIEPAVPGLVSSAPAAMYTGTSVPVQEITSRVDVLDTLARMKVDGKYLFTGNKLADLFTGTAYAASRNTILDEIAAIRNPEKAAVAHRPGAPLKRPANGWGN